MSNKINLTHLLQIIIELQSKNIIKLSRADEESLCGGVRTRASRVGGSME